MPHIVPTFAEDFLVDGDPRMVALDFWSYINARQANLGWEERDDRLWWQLEHALTEVKPVLLDPNPGRFRPFLVMLVEHWRTIDHVPSPALPEAVKEAQEIRRELADMLHGALQGGASPEGGRVDADAWTTVSPRSTG